MQARLGVPGSLARHYAGPLRQGRPQGSTWPPDCPKNRDVSRCVSVHIGISQRPLTTTGKVEACLAIRPMSKPDKASALTEKSCPEDPRRRLALTHRSLSALTGALALSWRAWIQTPRLPATAPQVATLGPPNWPPTDAPRSHDQGPPPPIRPPPWLAALCAPGPYLPGPNEWRCARSWPPWRPGRDRHGVNSDPPRAIRRRGRPSR